MNRAFVIFKALYRYQSFPLKTPLLPVGVCNRPARVRSLRLAQLQGSVPTSARCKIPLFFQSEWFCASKEENLMKSILTGLLAVSLLGGENVPADDFKARFATHRQSIK